MQWLEEIIVDRKVYFRQRAQLNDPNELRPTWRTTATEKEARRLAREVILARGDLRVAPAKRIDLQRQIAYRWMRTPNWVEAVLHELLDRVGIFCLSESPSIALMWAHYGDGHRGVCVEFDATIGLVAAALPVTYTDEVPVLDHAKDSLDERLRKCLFTKSSMWSYEQEWRTVARWRDDSRIEAYLRLHDVPQDRLDFVLAQNGPGHYSIPAGAVTSVILGSAITPESTKWVHEMIAKVDGSRIALRHAHLARNGEIDIRESASQP